MTIKLNGSSSGSVSLDAPAATTGGAAVTLTLPINDGDAGQVLQTDGAGNLTWVDQGACIQYVLVESDTDTDLGSNTNSVWTTAPAPFDSVTITPKRTGSKIKVVLYVPFYQDTGDLDIGITASYKIASGSYTRLGHHDQQYDTGLWAGYFNSPAGAADYVYPVNIDYMHTPASYSLGDVLTYKFEYWNNRDDCHWNGIRPCRAYARLEEWL